MMIDGRLKLLSKNKEQRIQQLNLLIHNCNIYGVRNEIKQVYIKQLNKVNEK